MTIEAERRQLQFALAIAACVPVFAGLWGAVYGSGTIGSPAASGAFDSHMRYLSGLLLAIGLLAWSCVPRIEERGARLGLLVLIVGIGGLIRFFATGRTGFWSPFILLPLVMELLVTPGLWFWQRRVARKLRNAPAVPAG
jgi:Domain of unknown function (DUF4345)